MRPYLRWGAVGGASVAAIIAAGFRVPALLSLRPLGYDDGVYGASVMLMRQGLDPYTDFFSSQGPLFLPMLRLFDMVSGPDPRSPRLAMVVTGSALAVAMYLLARLDHSPLRATVAGLLAAGSGLFILSAAPIQSDGTALAFALFAVVAAAADHRTRPWAALLSGVLIGAAFGVKTLFVAPVVGMAVALAWRGGGLPALSRQLGTATVTLLLPVLLTDPGRVWEQYVLFHLGRDRSPDLLGSLAGLGELMVRREVPLLALAVLAPILSRRRSDAIFTASRPGRLPVGMLWVWLAAMTGILLWTGFEGGFERYAAGVVPPLLLLSLGSQIPTRLALIVALAGLPFQWVASSYTQLTDLDPEDRRLVEIIAGVPSSSYVVGDDQGLIWMAGRLSHPITVDTSFARIEAGSLTASDVATALADPRTCLFFEVSGRLAGLELGVPAAFDLVLQEEDTLVAARPGCWTPP